jgi:hypothetical protein
MATSFLSYRSSVHLIYHNDLFAEPSTKIYPDIKDPNTDNLPLSHLCVVHSTVSDRAPLYARLNTA